MPQGQNKCFFSRFYRNYKIRIAPPCNFNCVLILGNCTYLFISHSATFYFVRPGGCGNAGLQLRQNDSKAQSSTATDIF